MTPEERQLISGLFERMRPAANQQRDREAENFIGEQLRAQPYAPYLLSQTVIVQDQALRAANDRIEQLESQARETQAQPQESSFLGSVGRSIFGGGQPDNRAQTVPPSGSRGFNQAPQDQGQYRAQGNPGGGSPWGQAAGGGIGGAMSSMGGAMGGGGGGFLKGALGAAAGVAGGVLLADGIRNLFSGGHNPYGIASGMGDMAGASATQAARRSSTITTTIPSRAAATSVTCRTPPTSATPTRASTTAGTTTTTACSNLRIDPQTDGAIGFDRAVDRPGDRTDRLAAVG